MEQIHVGCQDNLFADVIESGGDERLATISEHGNQYNVRPTHFSNVLNRGSCTCSPFTIEGYKSAKALHDSLDDTGFESVRARQTERIKRLLNYDNRDRFHVFYAPSGSDLCYYQLLFAKLIHPNRDIFNIVTCPEELGSGSRVALQGKYFAKQNQFGEEVVSGGPISRKLEVETAMMPARDPMGRIINHSGTILEAIQQHSNSSSINANLVIGSKSGIENNLTVIAQAPEEVMWTVDLCQFRGSRVLINGILGMNCSVMLTGSKFYQSPPFCAVLLVPRTLSERFSNYPTDVIEGFSSLFSRYDIPEDFPELRNHLPDYRNRGLLLRWEAALREMELFSELDDYDVNNAINDWNHAVRRRLHSSPFFTLMPGQEVTNKTIISFRVKSANERYLGHKQLKELYRYICTRLVTGLNGYDRCLFGQPVQYGSKSFIRLALGASDVRQFVLKGFEASNDMRLIEIIEESLQERS